MKSSNLSLPWKHELRQAVTYKIIYEFLTTLRQVTKNKCFHCKIDFGAPFYYLKTLIPCRVIANF